MNEGKTCRDCRRPFEIEGDFRGRHEPVRCRPCAALFRSRLVTTTGTVLTAGSRFVVVEAAGRRFRAVESYEGEFPVGSRLEFEHDPGPAEAFRLSLARAPRLAQPVPRAK